MAYPCSKCYKTFSTPYNRSRHENQQHRSDDEPDGEDVISDEEEEAVEDTDENSDASEMEDEAVESDGETSESNSDDGKYSRECWRFLFDELRDKEPDIQLQSEKLSQELLAVGVSEDWANKRKERLYYKMLSEELREKLLDLLLNMKILRKDSIYEQLMDDVKDSDLPFAEAFRDAWKKKKTTVVDEILRPAFPEEGNDDTDSDGEAAQSPARYCFHPTHTMRSHYLIFDSYLFFFIIRISSADYALG